MPQPVSLSCHGEVPCECVTVECCPAQQPRPDARMEKGPARDSPAPEGGMQPPSPHGAFSRMRSATLVCRRVRIQSARRRDAGDARMGAVAFLFAAAEGDAVLGAYFCAWVGKLRKQAEAGGGRAGPWSWQKTSPLTLELHSFTMPPHR